MAPKTQQLVILLAVAAAVLWYLKTQAGETVRRLNPTENDNYAYSGVNAVGEAVTGEPWSFGAWVWELTHPEQVAAERGL